MTNAYKKGLERGGSGGVEKGRKEVVDWIKKHYDFDDIRDKEASKEWKDQLKKWGIK